MNNNKKKSAKDIGFYALIIIIIMATIFILFSDDPSSSVEYSEVRSLFEEEQVKYFSLEGSTLLLQLKDDSIVTHELLSLSVFYEDLSDLITEQMHSGVLQGYDLNEGWTAPWWLSFVPYLVVMAVFVGLWFFMMNRSGLGGGGGDKNPTRFGKAKAKTAGEEQKKTFADVAGCDEEKAELQEIVDFLKDPKKYVDMGARIPKGVLLVGPPGTGKTLLAKAVAGEAGVNFLTISGSDFVELYVGVGASRVRDLFDQAKRSAPAIIFIDEIDAVGRQRGSGLGGGHDEREQTLNQLLVEMDGFGNSEGVIVMAATNRADILDNALLRPGRFDRRVYVSLPDVKGREAILKVHARGKSLAGEVDLANIAKGTAGFSGADLENLLNEAAILAVRRRARFIEQSDIDEAILKVSMGPEKKSRRMSEKARRLTAYHEAGHAVAGKFLPHTDPVHFITIIPRGQAGGFTLFRPEEDAENYDSRSELFENIVMSLGGRMAEKLFLDDISTGASGDIQQASSLARSMVTRYGMSDRLGPISFDSADHSIFIGRDFGTTKSYSEETAGIIDEEVKRIFDEAAERCEAILTGHRDLLIGVAEYLLEHESMDGEVFHYYCEHGELPPAAPTAPEAPSEPSAPVEPELAESELFGAFDTGLNGGSDAASENAIFEQPDDDKQ